MARSLGKRDDGYLAPAIGICGMCGAPVRKESERIGAGGTGDVIRRQVGVPAAIGNIGHARLGQLMLHKPRQVEPEAAVLIVDEARGGGLPDAGWAACALKSLSSRRHAGAWLNPTVYIAYTRVGVFVERSSLPAVLLLH